MGSADEFESIKALYKDANDLLGNIVKVTPTSKAVGDLAIFMFKNGLTKENILTAGAGLSYPDSVVSYFQGMMGQPYGGFPKELQKIVLELLSELNRQGTTIIIVTHSQRDAKYAHRVIQLLDGQIVAENINRPLEKKTSSKNETV